MSADYGETVKLDDEYNEPGEGKRDNRIWIILAVVAFILICCCIIAFFSLIWLWNEGGDLILENLGLTF
jgi:hypothetical protein